MSDIADILNRAADLIEPKGAWTRKFGARDANSRDVDPLSERAVRWCLEGAYLRCGGRWNDAGWRVLRNLIGEGPITWNDAPERTQPEVVAALRKAAARGEQS